MAKSFKPTPLSELRIIAGKYRGRKIAFREAQGLRPTGDRLRETLFSWLQPMLPGAQCLDLFSGSGALGFEAASRGASEVVLVEAHAATAQMLSTQKAALNATEIAVVNSDALRYLQSRGSAFDVIFLDPPFHGAWLQQVLPVIARRALVKSGGYCYIELEREQEWPLLPEGWLWHRQKEAGQVKYGLARNVQESE